ncbi:MAG: hypothetical protein AB7N65_19620 [Vicinamibacterales bacterium]
MPNAPLGPDHDDLPDRDEIDEVLSRANPNPNRAGCPPRETLIALARRAQPINDPAYEHLVKCSPCYREFRALQDAATSARPVPAARKFSAWMLGAAAVLLVSLTAVWWLTRGERSDQYTAVASLANRTPVQAQLDLRNFAVLRSEQATADATAVRLPAKLVDVTLLLPVGSEPGSYDVQLLDGQLRSKGEATGTATIADFVTTLNVRLDLQQLAPGAYQLAVRRQGDNWRMFPAVVR